MHVKKLNLASCLLLVGAAFVLSSCSSSKFNLKKRVLRIQNGDGVVATVNAEIAVHQEERNYGFMNRKRIPDGTGMLFVFESDRVLSFWMKDTPHPLSIAYIDSSGVIRDIFDMTPFSLSEVVSSRSVRYALEVPQGWFERVGVKVGDVVCVDDDGRSLRNLN